MGYLNYPEWRVMASNNPLTRIKHKKALEAYRGRNLNEAKTIYLQIVGKDRVDDGAWAMLGITHALLNELDAAENCLQKAVNLNPHNFDALYNLGRVKYGQGQLEAATFTYQKALRLKPGHVDTLLGLGLSMAGMGQSTLARQFYEQILLQYPEHAAALDNLANELKNQGRADLAIPLCRRAWAANPLPSTYSNLLLCLHYPATHDPLEVFQEHLTWGTLQTRGYLPPNFEQTDRSPARKLRIGYVTPDLRYHSVAYFIEPLLMHHDRSQFELFCYLELAGADDMTGHLLKFAGTVRNTCGVSDDKVAATIRQDQVDILVDLAGHTSKNRLPVFAHKPAPIQMSYLGYPNTTGLPTVDYRITDAWADPPGMTEHLHTEKLLRLEKGFLCFTPPVESPGIAPLPANKNGYVTFGSFNALQKITADMLKLWARILMSVPQSKLLIKNPQLTDPAFQAGLRAQLMEYGVASERVLILGQTSKEAHMAAFGQVDIALDTFPYHGTTTTCDTLWMGVPVITLAGKSHVSRVGVSLLTRMGLSEFIADTEEEYIEYAVCLANSGEKLSDLRKSLRTIFEDSGLCDGLSFTRNVESTYRQVWQSWCAAT